MGAFDFRTDVMDELQGLFREYGLWVVFFGTMIEGDLTLLLAGVLARSGLFSFQDALLVGTSGGVAGDLIGYLLGRLFRSRARTLKFYIKAKPRLERLIGDIKKLEKVVLVVGVLLVIVFVVKHYRLGRRVIEE